MKWTKDDLHEVSSIFADFIERKECPRQKDCLEALEISKKNGGKIHVRKWDVVKKKVQYIIKKSNRS